MESEQKYQYLNKKTTGDELISERNLMMLKLFLGLDDDGKHTCQEIGEMFGLGHASIGRTIKRSTIKIVEAYLNSIKPSEVSDN